MAHVASLTQDLTTLEAQESALTTAVTEAQQQENADKQTVADKQNAVKSAENAVKSADEAYKNVQSERDNATTQVSVAQQQVANATQDVATHEATVQERNNDVTEKTSALQTANEELQQAQQAKADADALVAQKKQASEAENQTRVEREAALEQAQQAKAETQKKLDTAQQEATEAAQQLANAQGTLKQAQNHLNTAKADEATKAEAAKQAEELLAQGSLGYFKEKQATNAEMYLEHVLQGNDTNTPEGVNGYTERYNPETGEKTHIPFSQIKGLVHLNAKYSATNLDNMLKSLDYLDKGNEIRKQLGLPSWRVNDLETAKAQMATDWNTAVSVPTAFELTTCHHDTDENSCIRKSSAGIHENHIFSDLTFGEGSVAQNIANTQQSFSYTVQGKEGKPIETYTPSWQASDTEIAKVIESTEQWNPYDGWYTEEKALWDRNKNKFPAHEVNTPEKIQDYLSRTQPQFAEKVGHYTTIIQPSNVLTGYAYASRDYPNRHAVMTFHSQNFSAISNGNVICHYSNSDDPCAIEKGTNLGSYTMQNGKKVYDPSYTVQEYRQSILDYRKRQNDIIDAAANAKQATHAAETAVQHANADITAKQQLVEQSQAQLNQAKTAQQNAEQAVADAQQALNNVSSGNSDELPRLEQNATAKQQLVEQAQIKVSEAQSALETSKAQLNQAQDELTASRSALDTANRNVAHWNEVLASTDEHSAQAKLEQAKSSLASIQEALVHAQQVAADSKTHLQEALQKLTAYQENHETLTRNIGSAQTLAEQASDAEHTAHDTLTTVQEALQRAQNAVIHATTEYNNAQQVVATLETAAAHGGERLAQAQAALQTAQEALTQAQNKLQTATEAYNTAVAHEQTTAKTLRDAQEALQRTKERTTQSSPDTTPSGSGEHGGSTSPSGSAGQSGDTTGGGSTTTGSTASGEELTPPTPPTTGGHTDSPGSGDTTATSTETPSDAPTAGSTTGGTSNTETTTSAGSESSAETTTTTTPTSGENPTPTGGETSTTTGGTAPTAGTTTGEQLIPPTPPTSQGTSRTQGNNHSNTTVATPLPTPPEAPRALAPTESDFTPETENLIYAPNVTYTNTLLRIYLFENNVPDVVYAYFYSTPKQMKSLNGSQILQVQRDARGAFVEAVVPETSLGLHHIAVTNTQGTILGWRAITVATTQQQADLHNTNTSHVVRHGKHSAEYQLAATGSTVTPIEALGITLLLLGEGVLVLSKKRQHSLK